MLGIRNLRKGEVPELPCFDPVQGDVMALDEPRAAGDRDLDT